MTEARQVINVARFQNKVRALLGIDGYNPIPTVQDLVPCVTIEGDRPEWSYAGNEFLFTGDSQDIAAGGAGNAGKVALLNPSGSGIIAVVEHQSAQAAAGAFFELALGASEATIIAAFTQVVAFTSGNPRDTRLFGQQPACSLWSRNNVGLSGGCYRMRMVDPANSRPVFILHPGFGFVWQDTTLNEVFRLSLAWRERPQEQGKGS